MNKPRRATKDDMPRVLELIKELAIFEKEPDAVIVTTEQLVRDGFGQQPKFVCFVVEIDGTIEGIAMIYPRYSSWKGEVIHLEDLIVSQASRGKGLGTLLLDEVVKYGKQKGVKRISWDVLDWNEPAIKFYEQKGANVMRDWDIVQMDETAIDNYLAKL
ncbi:L-amino acid N-acyltransferase YncA [Winogradskyella wandonensis]|uniref:L-amino acid N-acyltransferase YncA n=1 Tax=Winogradskyella wandonensis TaxID=1442586 RepID=A0A4V2PTV3_9FLAO|nr:GNAT family N-acetyltransferase [Winogradskyella wandonensis]TCK68041.1 L-amino acid N-acyltransferase YncA [Winogradskyella wandonensis]